MSTLTVTISNIIGMNKMVAGDMSLEKRVLAPVLTLADVDDMAKSPRRDLVQQAEKAYVNIMRTIPDVVEVYMAPELEKVRFLTIVSDGERNPVYDAERKMRGAFPILGFGFIIVSTVDFTEEEIKRIKDTDFWYGNCVYKR